MKHSLATIMAALALVLPWSFALSAPALPEEGQCLTKREIQQRIESGEFRQLFEAIGQAGVQGKIIGSGRVCEIEGQWQWQISVMDDYGQSRVVNLPAR
jgi:hypothetical protein